MTKRDRNYRAEYDKYQGTPEQIKKRAQRNAARREYEKRNGDLPSTVDVDHKRMIKDGGSNDPKNLRAVHEKTNSAWRKGKKGYG